MVNINKENINDKLKNDFTIVEDTVTHAVKDTTSDEKLNIEDIEEISKKDEFKFSEILKIDELNRLIGETEKERQKIINPAYKKKGYALFTLYEVLKYIKENFESIDSKIDNIFNTTEGYNSNTNKVVEEYKDLIIKLAKEYLNSVDNLKKIWEIFSDPRLQEEILKKHIEELDNDPKSEKIKSTLKFLLNIRESFDRKGIKTFNDFIDMINNAKKEKEDIENLKKELNSLEEKEKSLKAQIKNLYDSAIPVTEQTRFTENINKLIETGAISGYIAEVFKYACLNEENFEILKTFVGAFKITNKNNELIMWIPTEAQANLLNTFFLKAYVNNKKVRSTSESDLDYITKGHIEEYLNELKSSNSNTDKLKDLWKKLQEDSSKQIIFAVQNDTNQKIKIILSTKNEQLMNDYELLYNLKANYNLTPEIMSASERILFAYLDYKFNLLINKEEIIELRSEPKETKERLKNHYHISKFIDAVKDAVKNKRILEIFAIPIYYIKRILEKKRKEEDANNTDASLDVNDDGKKTNDNENNDQQILFPPYPQNNSIENIVDSQQKNLNNQSGNGSEQQQTPKPEVAQEPAKETNTGAGAGTEATRLEEEQTPKPKGWRRSQQKKQAQAQKEQAQEQKSSGLEEKQTPEPSREQKEEQEDQVQKEQVHEEQVQEQTPERLKKKK